MKIVLSLIGNLFGIAAVAGTYYGAWQHNWIIILVCAIPQFVNIGYKVAKDL